MNVKEITDQAIELAGQSIDLFKARRFINEAIGILSTQYDTACSNKTIPIVSDDTNKEYPLPDDCFGVTKVLLNNYKYDNYHIEDGFIRFDSPGTFSVRYILANGLPSRKSYQKEVNIDIPGIHSAYHLPIAFYVAAQILIDKDANNPKGMGFMTRFNSLSESANTKLKRPRRKGARLPAPLFR